MYKGASTEGAKCSLADSEPGQTLRTAPYHWLSNTSCCNIEPALCPTLSPSIRVCPIPCPCPLKGEGGGAWLSATFGFVQVWLESALVLGGLRYTQPIRPPANHVIILCLLPTAIRWLAQSIEHRRRRIYYKIL